MTTHFIISVGTSIIANYHRRFGKGQPVQAAKVPLVLKDPPNWSYQEQYDKLPAPAVLCPNYHALVSVLKDEAYQGAEQTTVTQVKAQRQISEHANCYYHLIPTDTTDAIFCASFLGREVFHPSANVRYYVPKELGKAGEGKFTSQGLPNLLACLATILDQIDAQQDEALLILSGGYKAIIPYLTIAAMLYKRPAYYIYEEFKSSIRELVELPVPPLSVNAAEFRSVAVLLDNIINIDTETAAPYYNAIPQSFQPLLYLDEHDRFQYNAFGQRLKTMFTEAAQSPLRIRTSKNTLIDKLGPYRAQFLDMTHLGDTVWLGDKAPEMADHARHHHLNLFAYAELLLLPIFAENKEFLAPVELFLLLSMIYLHDCGHAMATFCAPNGARMPLLPTEIRTFHNLLGFLRLQDPAFHRTLQRQGLRIDPQTLRNIATLSVYHRKKMPLLQGNYTGPDRTVFRPLGEQTLIQDGQKIEGERLTLLAALFRIIDGMDKQIGRAGDAVEITMKAEAILADLPHLWQRVERLRRAVAALPQEATQPADQILLALIAEYCQLENVGGVLKKKETERFYYEELRDALRQQFNAEGDRYLPLLWEYLEARVRFFFQALQPSFYYSDLLLAMPRVTHREGQGRRTITIAYTNAPEPSGPSGAEQLRKIWGEILDWLKQQLDQDAPERYLLQKQLETADQVVAGVGKEYNQDVQAIFEQHRMGLNLVYQSS